MTDSSNPCEIIPISFHMKAILKDRYYNTGNDSKYVIQMCSQVKASGVKLPEVHGVDNGVNPNIQPERLVQKSLNTAIQQTKPRLGHGREGLRRGNECPYTSTIASAIQRRNSNKRTDFIKTRRHANASE